MTIIKPDSSVPPSDSSSPAAAAATTSGQVQVRISDVLALPLDDEDDEPEGKSFKTYHRRDLRSLLMSEEGFFDENRRQSPYCSSLPCRLVGRWMSWIRRVKIKGISRKCCRREKGINRAEADVQPRCLTNGLNDVGCRNEACFNAGIGAYLLYLVAATRNELDRINAARVEMETVLCSTKQLQRRRRIVEGDGDDDVLLEFPIMRIQTRKSVEAEEDHDDEECEPQFPTNLYALPAAASSSSSSSSSSTVVSGSETPKRGELLESMEQLEAELEAELELLQLQLDGDKLMEHSQLQRVRNGEETESSKTYSMTSSEDEEEVIDPEHDQADAECPVAVSPYELERRLHEVLEARQKEEIRELEAALELVKRKLQEKELQVSWWKAVARGRRLSCSSS